MSEEENIQQEQIQTEPLPAEESMESAPAPEPIEAQDGEAVIEKQPNAFCRWLNKYFHFYERGSSVKGEIGAGIGTFFIAVCSLLLNTQIIGAACGSYAGAYLATSLIAFVGTILLGLICNLPIVQSASLGISTVFIQMMTVNSGLTYYNVLAISFICALVYLAIAVSPIKNYITDCLPDGVKKAIPIGVGLYVIYTGLTQSGLLTFSDTSLLIGSASNTGVNSLQTYYFWLMIIGIAIFVLFKLFKKRKSLFATFGILIGLMWLGGIALFTDTFIGGETATTMVYQRLNLIIATDGADPYNIVIGFQSLEFGKIFTEGFDFSGYTSNIASGSVALLIIQCIIVFTGLTMFTNVGNLHAVKACDPDMVFDERALDYTGKKRWFTTEQKAYVIGASLNVVAPLIGATPTSIAPQSAVGVNDKGKTGLTSVVCGIGFFIALFTWAFFAIFATKTNGVGMWIDETETKLAAYVQDSFAFVDLIMVFVGATMLKGFKDVNYSDATELIPFIGTVIGVAFFSNFAIGIALGTVLNAICLLCTKQWKAFKPSVIVFDSLMLIYLIFALI